ncbi:Sec-independent protein translocase subunit TatA/TatB [Methanosarcina sp.]|uniref:Sec-independent protein translocase subunit TatA/TatB n=1 Tax=Methanosarcina sp. TaxID=2213 RepID=UPI003BB596C0
MIGTQELIMIFGVVLLLFGANKLPELARSMGSSVGEFKKAQTESERNLREFEKSIKEPTVTKSKIQETAEKLGIDTKSKTDNQLLDEIHKSAEKPKEVSKS